MFKKWFGWPWRLFEKTWGVLLCLACVMFIIAWISLLTWKMPAGPVRIEPDITQAMIITQEVSYRFEPDEGIYRKRYKNVGVTYYTKGEPTVPGVTMRSGRHVYEGAIAVSQDMWGKIVNPGDFIYVVATGKWYTVEDTMDPKYKMRVDIYTHHLEIANSGSSRSDIVIKSRPKH